MDKENFSLTLGKAAGMAFDAAFFVAQRSAAIRTNPHYISV